MSVVTRGEIFKLSNALTLRINHFAKGTFLTRGVGSRYNVNRLLFVIDNPNGDYNYLEDAHGRIVFKPGHWYLVPALHPVRYWLDDELEFVSIQFYLGLYYGVDLLSVLSSNYTGYDPETSGRLAEIFDSSDEVMLAFALHEVVFHILGVGLPDMNEQLGKQRNTLAPYQEILDFIADNCTAMVSVTDLAEIMNMSRGAFTRKFTIETGMAPKKFFNRILMNRAAELLRKPQITVKEVAELLQFSSEFSFSRFFKKMTGLPPKEFQRSELNGYNIKE